MSMPSGSSALMPTGANLRSPEYHVTGHSYRWYSDGSLEGTSYGYSHLLFGENYSQGHKRDKFGHFQGSSDWLMYKFEVDWNCPVYKVYRSGYPTYPAYQGSINSGGFSWAFPPISFDSLVLDNFNHGAEAFAAIRPDLPDFSIISDLYELKDPLEFLKGKLQALRRSRPRLNRKRLDQAASDAYVAYYFAWLPLYNDIQKWTRSFKYKKKRFDQLIRDEGRSVQRRRNLSGSRNKDEKDSITETENHSAPWNPYVAPNLETQCYFYGQNSYTVRTAGDSKRVWAVGRSQYFLPSGPRDDAWKKSIENRILGGQLSPDQLYNMIPWSWAADYFSGLGHMLQAVAPGVADNYIILSAWTMVHEKYWDKRTYHWFAYNSGYNGTEMTSTCEIRRESKTRMFSSPIGWGLETPSDHQMSLLGALGYSSMAQASEGLPSRKWNVNMFR